MKKILMLNTLPLINFEDTGDDSKTAGNQTLYNTLKGYSDHGIQVTMLTFADVPKVNEAFPGVIVRRSSFFLLYAIMSKMKKLISDLIKNRERQTRQRPKTEIDRRGASLFALFWRRWAYREGLRLARELEPDLIYGYEIYSTIPAKRLADQLGLPLVTRFQGTELGLLLDSEQFYQATDYLKGTAVDADLIIMANDGTDGDKVLQKLGLDENKVRFWPNGLHNKEKYLHYKKNPDYKKQLKLPEESFVICTANRFVDWKRIDRIIRVMAELNRFNPDVYLLAIGDGPEKEALEKLAQSLNLDTVIFTGVMEHEDTVHHIANADLFITLNQSGNLGNSILEALALGTVTCTLKNDSVEKVLTDGINAILFDQMDEKRIAQRLAEVIKDEKTLQSLRNNAREYAADHLLSWPERMEMEIKEIRKLMN
ncbi:glycosyltransferase family 4 protein [Planococcus salinus]|uniref:Glycosyltransferase n=1 Tax=Planococcus salinus TaxID=1848460 RepID=A0A3M8PEQ7_9BACL|nr:glycosyltransferase family 4 protein [Planococcus salinus]RNF41260.1 glycosyltransferase [Planococcus salinus]